MTERGRAALDRDRDRLAIGPSSMRWERGELVIAVREWGFPLPRRVIGEIRITPKVWGQHAFVLNETGRHIWQPITPLASVTLELEAPRLRWEGVGYLDHNRGDVPIADGFIDWTWQRAVHGKGALVAYAGRRHDNAPFGFCIDFRADGTEHDCPMPPSSALPLGFWRVPRAAHGGQGTRLIRTLEDTPFYTRSLVDMVHQGERLEALQESLSLTRLTNPVVQLMLPFRMPRRG